MEISTKLPDLIHLARLLTAKGHTDAARGIYDEAIKLFPEDVASRVNLGGLLLRERDNAGARMQYEAALRIDPGCVEAHGGMYYALAAFGEREAAGPHRKMALSRRSIYPGPYRGDTRPITVLLLLSSTGGNSPIEPLIDNSIFQTLGVVADFYDPATPLLEHQLVINAVGDIDSAEGALRRAESLLALTSAPVLNPPVASPLRSILRLSAGSCAAMSFSLKSSARRMRRANCRGCRRSWLTLAFQLPISVIETILSSFAKWQSTVNSENLPLRLKSRRNRTTLQPKSLMKSCARRRLVNDLD